MTADVGVVQPGSQQECRRLDAAAGDHHDRRSHAHSIQASPGPSLDAVRAAVADEHPTNAAARDDPGSAVVRVLEERQEGRALAAERASVLAGAAALLAT